ERVVVADVVAGNALGVRAEREVEEGHGARLPVAPLGTARVAQLGERLGEGVRRPAAHRPAIGVPGGSAQRDLRLAADEELRPLAVRRRRPHAALAGPQAAELLELALERPAARMEVGA